LEAFGKKQGLYMVESCGVNAIALKLTAGESKA
jgi:hypothetical protein